MNKVADRLVERVISRPLLPTFTNLGGDLVASKPFADAKRH